MRRVAALAATALALALAAPAAASYPRPCGGAYDTRCYTYDCSRNCVRIDCEVYVDVLFGTQFGCVG